MKNNWTMRFSASRRAKDRALLEELERKIEAEEKAKDEERDRIARVFGRPVDSTRH